MKTIINNHTTSDSSKWIFTPLKLNANRLKFAGIRNHRIILKTNTRTPRKMQLEFMRAQGTIKPEEEVIRCHGEIEITVNLQQPRLVYVLYVDTKRPMRKDEKYPDCVEAIARRAGLFDIQASKQEIIDILDRFIGYGSNGMERIYKLWKYPTLEEITKNLDEAQKLRAAEILIKEFSDSIA